MRKKGKPIFRAIFFLQGIVLMRGELACFDNVRKIRGFMTQVIYYTARVNPSGQMRAVFSIAVLIHYAISLKIHKISIHTLTCSVYT